MAAFIFIGDVLNPGSQLYTSGSGSFVVPHFARNLRVRMWGGGGAGPGTNPGVIVASDTSGTDSTFDASAQPAAVLLSAGGGTRGSGTHAGGTASGGDINTSGSANSGGSGGAAANTAQGGGAGGTVPGATNTPGNPGSTYGGGGSSATTTAFSTTTYGNGGGGGAFCEKVFAKSDLTYGASISYSVGAGGSGVGFGSPTYAGGNGAAGAILIEWDY